MVIIIKLTKKKMRKISKRVKSERSIDGNDNQIGTCVNYGLTYKETKGFSVNFSHFLFIKIKKRF